MAWKHQEIESNEMDVPILFLWQGERGLLTVLIQYVPVTEARCRRSWGLPSQMLSSGDPARPLPTPSLPTFL